MKKRIIAVSQLTVFLAESQVLGCEACSKSADVCFERVLDAVTGRKQSIYVLPVPAHCPCCDGPIMEATRVEV